ncbi:MLO-like protein [Actinidia chinensis var. chinensis]|uniref:MLO-like protein n=1 Tax=Actinidia chinensis var. chinensis TaxID=1590841 RepID=A0A2R6PZA7_ACTCC|nr:MLO-like protein [Actinidia chinensis var. chinensis]
MRQGFVSVHLAPGSKFDFQKYITRSLEDDFKVVVGISPLLCGSAVLYLLLNVHGLQAMFWLYMPLIVVLAVGTKLQAIVTQMAVEIQERQAVVQGIPLVQVSDRHFWFSWTRLILHLIHLILFQCHSHGSASCYWMGSNMKKSIFDEQTAKALKNWRKNALKKKNERKPGPAATRKLGGSPVESPDNSPKLTHSHETDRANASSTVDIRSENPPHNDNGLKLGIRDLLTSP